MSKDLDESLRSALRPEDPGEQFTRKVMAAVAQQNSAGSARPRAMLRWASAALVISLVVAVITAHHRQERGREARRELIQALQLTGQKLDVAYQAVKDVERAP